MSFSSESLSPRKAFLSQKNYEYQMLEGFLSCWVSSISLTSFKIIHPKFTSHTHTQNFSLLRPEPQFCPEWLIYPLQRMEGELLVALSGETSMFVISSYQG